MLRWPIILVLLLDHFFRMAGHLPRLLFRTLFGRPFGMRLPRGTNSRPTFCETPPKPPRVCAAAAIKRAWAFERTGMDSNLFNFGADPFPGPEAGGKLKGGDLRGEGGGLAREHGPADQIAVRAGQLQIDMVSEVVSPDHSPHGVSP